MHNSRNPAHLLGIGADPAVTRLLRACGVEEACITGIASDYNAFMALAFALPLCEGHPLREDVNTKLAEATGLAAPLCSHTAKRHWDAWVETCLMGGGRAEYSSPTVCPLCAPVSPVLRRTHEFISLPDPTAVSQPDLASWSGALEAVLSAHRSALFHLSDGYKFTRPNPYHANLAVEKVFRGEALTRSEEDLLVTQALRVWGIILSERGGKHEPNLILQGGDPDEVISLLNYLDTSRALPSIVWIPNEPRQACAVSGLYRRVGTGYALSDADTIEVAEEKKRIYASVAPIGRAMVIVGEG